MVSHGLVIMWGLTKIPNPIWYPGTGTQVQCCVAIVIPTVFHPRLDILDPYPYPYPWYPYPWSCTRTHTHIYGRVPIPVPMTSSHFVPVPIPVPMVSYPYPYPYLWSRTHTRTHTHGLVPIPVPVPMIRTHTTSLALGIVLDCCRRNKIKSSQISQFLIQMPFLQRYVERDIRSAHPPQKISKPSLFFNFFINQTFLVNIYAENTANL